MTPTSLSLTSSLTLPRIGRASRWSTVDRTARAASSAARQPSIAWQRVHLRSAARAEAIAGLDAGIDVAALLDDDLISTAYADLDDLIADLVSAWTRRVQTRLDLAMESGELLQAATRTAIDRTAAELPGVHKMLVLYAEHPLVRRSRRLAGNAV